MRIILTVIFTIALFTAKSQQKAPKILWRVIPMDHSLGFISNVGSVLCRFPFEADEEYETIYIVENFTRSDFDKLINHNDIKKISRTKIWVQGYVVKENDFLYRYNKNNQMHFYYIVKRYIKQSVKNYEPKPISRMQLGENNYEANPYDLCSAVQKTKDLQFYYIIKNPQEEEIFQR